MRRLLVALAMLGNGCGGGTCGSTDVDCFLAHLQVRGMPTESISQLSIARSLQAPAAPVDLGTGGFTSLGCFKDEAGTRDLDGGASWSPSLTVEGCARSCAGWNYFAVQDQNWCYCGDQSGRYGAAPSSECNLACAGASGELCGGYLRNQLYAFPSSVDAGTTRATPVFAPTIAVGVDSLTLPAGTPTAFTLTFEDENSCTPSLCFSFCSQSLRCSAASLCTHTLRDGIQNGTWRGILDATRGAGSTASLILRVDAYGTPDCADFPSLVHALEGSGFTSGARPVAGGSITLPVSVTKPSSGGTHVGGNATCGMSNDSCPGSSVCTYQACVTVDALGACSTGYRTSDEQEFDCNSCSDCSAAAAAVTQHCCP